MLLSADFGPTVLGRPIEILAADYKNKPDIATAIARTWFDADGVSMITDLTNSAAAIAVHSLAHQKRRLANSGADTTNAIKQAAEFGLTRTQELAAFLPFITDIQPIGLASAQSLMLITAYYWDRGGDSRASATASSSCATQCRR